VQAGGGSVSKDSGAGSKDKNERGPGLTDQEKLILQKAKMIEAKNRFKAKWPEPPRRKVRAGNAVTAPFWCCAFFTFGAKCDHYCLMLFVRKSTLLCALEQLMIGWASLPQVHHDYLLEEMSWLSTDFRQERKWKMALAKKVALAVVKYHSQKQLKADRADRSELFL
jgi:hypothetical protein